MINEGSNIEVGEIKGKNENKQRGDIALAFAILKGFQFCLW